MHERNALGICVGGGFLYWGHVLPVGRQATMEQMGSAVPGSAPTDAVTARESAHNYCPLFVGYNSLRVNVNVNGTLMKNELIEVTVYCGGERLSVSFFTTDYKRPSMPIASHGTGVCVLNS